MAPTIKSLFVLLAAFFTVYFIISEFLDSQPSSTIKVIIAGKDGPTP